MTAPSEKIALYLAEAAKDDAPQVETPRPKLTRYVRSKRLTMFDFPKTLPDTENRLKEKAVADVKDVKIELKEEKKS